MSLWSIVTFGAHTSLLLCSQDVIALRKTSGTIHGDIRLNGYEQETISFRRCSGYVEQFDVQAAELTVRETVLFSARLRLDSQDPDLANDDINQKYTDQVLNTLELTTLADSVVGRDGEGGLSFEQRKRLSIAVELAASPSIIFLDEVSIMMIDSLSLAILPFTFSSCS
jgi:ABC-type multidrug transport system ATPase subunit